MCELKRGKRRACGRAAGSVNAIGLVVGYLLDNGLCTPQEERATRMLRTRTRIQTAVRWA
ncbi:MAG: hypothetical protein ACLRRT_13995 [Ruthenibacterium lactatiformans]